MRRLATRCTCILKSQASLFRCTIQVVNILRHHRITVAFKVTRQLLLSQIHPPFFTTSPVQSSNFTRSPPPSATALAFATFAYSSNHTTFVPWPHNTKHVQPGWIHSNIQLALSRFFSFSCVAMKLGCSDADQMSPFPCLDSALPGPYCALRVLA